MTRNQLILAMIVLLVGFQFVCNWLFDYRIGYEVPFFGFIGVEPFNWLADWSVLIGGGFIIFLYVMLERRRK